MTDLTIWCLVNGTSSGNVFSVKVPSNGTVDDLKDLIKAKQAPGFDDIAASSLTLWKVEIPTTPVRQITLSLPNEESILSCLNLNEDQQATITQCRNNNRPIHLSRLNLSLDQKAVITRCQLSDVDVVTVKFLGDPSVDISDDDAFGTKPLPRRNIHVIVQRPPSVPLQPPGSPSIAKKAFNTLLEKLEKDFFHTDTHISRFLCSFVKGDLTIPNAKCCVKGLPRTWVRSRDLLQASTQPALYLLHPKRPHSMTSPSVQALDKIKKYQNNDMITFFGVSGCGKTRAVVEMLAQNWGFYLNGSQTDRGSMDVSTLFESAQKMQSRYFSSDRMQNGLNVQAITVCLLISRLMVLQHCLSLGRHDTFTCDRWMLLQVCPGAFDATVPDVFDIVFTAVLDTYHEQTPVIPLPSLERLLQERFRQVQGQISSFTPDPRTNKLLVVLDEAQTLSDHGRNFFVSHVDSEQPRSFLSPIIYGLRSISKNSLDYCVVTCGTGIGADELEILVNSGGMATNEPRIDPRILNFPGWETEDQVATYINSLGDAMSEDDRAMLHTLIPKAAVQELFLKLRGRFRPIITTIEDIIASGSASHWKQAIEIRVEALVSYPKIFPVRGNLCSDIKRMLEKVAKDPAKFEDAVDLRYVLMQTVLCKAALGVPWSLPGEEPILVESAFGRIREAADKAAATETTIDEPFVFRAAYNFIRNEEKGFYEMFKKQYRNSQDEQFAGKIFERHAPLDLIHVFHNKPLKQELFSIPKAAEHHKTPKTPIPQFEPVTFPKRLFGHTATIVGWEGYEWGIQSQETLTMDNFLEAHCKNNSRRGKLTIPAFYYPGTSPSGPDIVFVLRIDGQLYPVFVQNKLLVEIHPSDVEDARLTVYETKIKKHVPNLANYCPGGKYLSLIYSYCEIKKTPREGWDGIHIWDSESKTETDHSQDVLCDSEIGTDHSQDVKKGNVPLMQLLMIIDGGNMRDFVPEGAADLLEIVKGAKRVRDQPATSGRAGKKVKQDL